MVGHYLGDPANPCITIIDTPGTSDTEGRDCKHGIALAEGIKRIGSITAFMMLFSGENPRFTSLAEKCGETRSLSSPFGAIVREKSWKDWRIVS